MVDLGRLRRRRRGPRRIDPQTLRDAAHRKALAALAAIDAAQPPVALATAVSLALRRFLADSCGEPALFETHEEFLARGEALDRLPEPLREETADTFAALASVKYAADRPLPPSDLIELARSLVDRLHAAPLAP